MYIGKDVLGTSVVIVSHLLTAPSLSLTWRTAVVELQPTKCLDSAYLTYTEISEVTLEPD